VISAGADQTVILWNLNWVQDLDQVLDYGCTWVYDYLQTNPDVDPRDRNLCDGYVSSP
jgi:hypothetical protein